MATILGNPEALVAEVIRRAQHRAAEMAEEARRRAAAILEDAKKESDSIRRQSEQVAERQVAAVVRRNSARAQLEALRRFITLREEPIKRVWRAAEERLRQLIHQPTYRDILKRCGLRAARELGASELVLAADPVGHRLLSKETLEQWSQEAGVQFRPAPEPATAWGGLLAASGRLRFDATFPTQLALAQTILRERVFQILSKEEH
ncbi:MAG: synthase kDa subunit [Bryobacterales bacterium]|nr:synthase kDa subunit [Bryobacterales bacterium]